MYSSPIVLKVNPAEGLTDSRVDAKVLEKRTSDTQLLCLHTESAAAAAVLIDVSTRDQTQLE